MLPNSIANRVFVLQGRREFILVDAERGIREPAFEHAWLAEAIGRRLPDIRADRLPLDRLEFRPAENPVEFRAVGKPGREEWEAVGVRD